MNKEAAGSSETLVTTHVTTYYYNRKDQKFSFHGCENLIRISAATAKSKLTLGGLNTALVLLLSVTDI
jgi:hypothetical protein